MKKYLFLSMVAILVMTQPMSVFAQSKTTSDLDLDKAKVEAYEELVEDGTIEEINAEIDQYYETYGEQSIYSQNFEEATFEEKAQQLEEMEANDFNISTDTPDISTDTLKSAAATSGTNTMPWTNFANGDIVLVHDGNVPYGYFRHSGTYYASKGKCISAQLGQGVIYESKSWYNLNYDSAVGVRVVGSNTSSTVKSNVMKFLQSQLGKPYSLVSGYLDYSSWSCCKLPWVGWGKYGKINIAVNPLNGVALTSADISVPDSIYRSPNVQQFAVGN